MTASAATSRAFSNHFRNTGMGNTRLVISVPAGSPNEGAATRMMTEIKSMVVDFGFSDTVTVTEPYSAPRGTEAPLRLSYLQYIAEGPACGRWPTNLARQKDNLNYDNFGCAQQRNLAAQIANPADLIGPRSMTPSRFGAARGRDRQIRERREHHCDSGRPSRPSARAARANSEVGT